MPKKKMQDIRAPRKKAKKHPTQTQSAPQHTSQESDAKQKPATFSERQFSPQKKQSKALWRSVKPRKQNTHTRTRRFAGYPPNARRASEGSTKKRRVFIWALIVLGTVFSAFLVSAIFSGATITVTPREEKSIIDGTFNAVQGNGDTDGVSYQVMTLSENTEIDIPANKEQEVQEKASGTIVVYNSHSSASQRLIKNTRFEAPDGRVYRTDKSIVVPGTTVENGEIVPGSIDVVVYADEPGMEYNIGLTDFTIPGFKDDPRYETFYARSKTEMTGGFSGVKRSPEDSDIAEAEEELKTRLRETLFEKSKAQKPDGFTLYDDARTISFNKPDISVENDTATIRLKGTLEAAIFHTDALEEFIATQSLASYEGASIRIPNIDALSFSLIAPDAIEGEKQIQFSLSGNVTVVWDTDTWALKNALTGVPKDGFQRILSDFPHIRRAEVSIRPFWKRAFPETTDDIRVVEKRKEQGE